MGPGLRNAGWLMHEKPNIHSFVHACLGCGFLHFSLVSTHIFIGISSGPSAAADSSPGWAAKPGTWALANSSRGQAWG